jgi:hypothetical protein
MTAALFILALIAIATALSAVMTLAGRSSGVRQFRLDRYGVDGNMAQNAAAGAIFKFESRMSPRTGR